MKKIGFDFLYIIPKSRPIMIKVCEYCGKELQLKIISRGKHTGQICKKDQTKRFCGVDCLNNWQRTISWEDRIGKDVADEIRKNTSIRVSGDNNPTCKKEIAEKVSNSLKKYLENNPRIGEKNSFYGKKHTDEYIKWASESRKGKRSYDEIGYQKLVENTLKKENHPNWKGGTSYHPYSSDFDVELKKKIKLRDSNTCGICEKITQKIQIHHIDYDKLNSSDKNLICLCNKCHGRTNFNRGAWIKYFEELIKNKYDKMSSNDILDQILI